MSTIHLKSFLVHKEHRHLTDATSTNDQGLLYVGATARSRDKGQLRRLVLGVFPLYGLESRAHPGDNLLRGGIHQQNVGHGVGLAGLRQGIGKDDAARLRHQALATRQADELLLGLAFLALGIGNAVFGQQALHIGAGTPQRPMSKPAPGPRPS